jgi:1,4-dihydroxy-2-naphthoate octaprenyltransferase
MRRIIFYLRMTRAAFFPASMVPVFTAAAYHYYIHSHFRFFIFLLHLFCVICFHAASNVMNDYDDYRSGCDEMNRDFIAPFTGGSRMIQEGIVSPDYVRKTAIVLFGLGTISGLFLTFLVHYSVALFFPPALLGGYLYTRFFAKHGIGEFVIFIHFGILTTLSGFYVQSLSIDPGSVLLAIVNGMFVVNILLINEFPDSKADKKAGKNTLVVRFGEKKAFYFYILFYAIGYGTILLGVITHQFPFKSLVVMITMVLPVAACLSIAKTASGNFKKAIILTIANLFLTGILLIISFI